MIEITNRKNTPIQIPIISRDDPNKCVVLNIPGIGKGKNIFFLQDERVTDYIERARVKGLISVRQLTD